ncbi:MAG: prepilin peptidase [Victivallales bacterium]|nr:prepilin peptidase [Victivallales bacterium]
MAIFDRTMIGPMLWFASLVVGTFGLCVGSFLNVVVWRLPRGKSLSHPGSHCPNCGHVIRAWENIPILSWLLLRARCSGCGLPISVRYPLVEAANGILWVALWYRLWGSGLPLTHALAWFFLASALLSIALIDIELFLIPDKITLTGMALAVVLALVFPETQAAGEGGAHSLISSGVESLLGQGASSPRWLALARLLAGAALGYGLLWVVRTIGRRCWGRVTRQSEAVTTLCFSKGIMRIEGEADQALAQILPHPEDRIVVHAESGELRGKKGKSTPWEAGKVVVGRDGARCGDSDTTLGKGTELRLQARSWSLPREVLGFGDLKLMAMLGAFLGPDACMFIVALGALSGLVVAGGWLLLARRGLRPVPFGPFLAIAALLWLFAGPELLGAYSRWLAAAVLPAP